MQTLANVLDRLFRQLATDLNYSITDSEIGLYVSELSDLGLYNLSEACLAMIAEDRPLGVMPSLLEFRRKMEELKFEKPQRAIPG